MEKGRFRRRARGMIRSSSLDSAECERFPRWASDRRIGQSKGKEEDGEMTKSKRGRSMTRRGSRYVRK